ncbi:MAG TPA: hypothetical protein VMU04_10970 [Candidatus Acidoferrum sp.]|nr:hypothetical protein [Candidatus Acidoferrum sp.]
MKLKSSIQAAALGLAGLALNSQFSTALAQGSLTPPGPPGATMLTLSQIEPRTPIASAPFTITQTGSYYLTTNLTVSTGDAIDINTNGVTLDLNGFTISSTDAYNNGNGITIKGTLGNITIANGFIQGGVTNNGSGVYSGSGFSYGIVGPTAVNVLVSRVSISGCRTIGIYLNLSDSTVVESCTVRTVGANGIYAFTIKQSSVIDCAGDGILGTVVSDCQGQSTFNGSGVQAGTAQNCWGDSNGSYAGVNASTALNCSGSSSSSGNGVEASTAINCWGRCDGSGSAVHAYTAQNCYGLSQGSGYGVYAVYIASGCYGYSASGTGLYAQNAAFCTGYRTNGTAIQATIATGCYAASGTNYITYKYNMP